MKISVKEVMKNLGMNMNELIETCEDSVVPACCSEGCYVEPDGHCEHGHPSVPLALGVI